MNIRREHYTDNHHAFTLIELMVVMLIIVILYSISVPAFRNIGRGSALRNSARTVYNSLSLARQWAITHKEEVKFYYKNVSNTNSCFYVINEDDQIISKSNNLPLEVKFEVPDILDHHVAFKSDGGVKIEGPGEIEPAEITIQEDREGSAPPSRTITINKLTGGIKIEEQ